MAVCESEHLLTNINRVKGRHGSEYFLLLTLRFSTSNITNSLLMQIKR